MSLGLGRKSLENLQALTSDGKATVLVVKLPMKKAAVTKSNPPISLALNLE